MNIRVNIVSNDITAAAKVILIDEKNRVLLLKRSGYVKKYSEEWDFPGGHLKENESLEAGLTREVWEETGLTVRDPSLVTIMGNIHFFKAKYDSQPIKLSSEHVAYSFLSKKDLKTNDKFQKIALMVLGEEDG